MKAPGNKPYNFAENNIFVHVVTFAMNGGCPEWFSVNNMKFLDHRKKTEDFP